jgi:hypothetical protein
MVRRWPSGCRAGIHRFHEPVRTFQMEKKMTPLSATNALTTVPKLTEVARSAPRMQGETSLSSAPWLFAAIAQIREVEATGRNIAGVGDLRIDKEAARRARQLPSFADANYIPTPLIAPVPGGGLSITWSVGEREVKLAVEPGGMAYCFKVEADEVLNEEEGPVTQHTLISDRLRWMASRNHS